VPSFDVVSKLDWAEVTNALNQAQKELSQRFDFKGTEAEVERNEAGIVVRASEDDRVRAAIVVLQEKLIRRKVSLKHFEVPKKAEKGPKGSSRMLILVQEGVEIDKARAIVKLIKDSKLKVQAAIHEQSVRVSGKNRDDLQAVIQLLRRAESLNIELQFNNFRD
jgi:cyclic-di-GMP-binding protein